MQADKLFAMPWARLYPMYLQKVQRKGRTQAELDEVIGWLTGHGIAQLRTLAAGDTDVATFFAAAPAYNPTHRR